MFAARHIPYSQTNAFSKVVLDYLEGNKDMASFYSFPPSLEGIKNAVAAKKEHSVNRPLLVNVLEKQYSTVPHSEAVQNNIQSLLQKETFTVCTAHQPNLFTGPLYFIYKILHAIKLAHYLNVQIPEQHFVPVFYMGCEDADLAELNHFTANGKKYEWRTNQTGAVGRMKIDKALIALVNELEQQVGVDPFGKEWIGLLKNFFTEGKDIQTATFELVHQLFEKFGLVVLIPDNYLLKSAVVPVFEEEIFKQTSSSIVEATSARLNKNYNVQAHPREINLFYLKDAIRERIILEKNHYLVNNTPYRFTKEELKKELEQYPDRFSPNVILRGVYQETVLPNVAFIGGGGELAYWLQLKDLFQHLKVPFPVLILRNSFLILEKESQALIQKLNLTPAQLFDNETRILDAIVEREGKKPKLNGELNKLEEIYAEVGKVASLADPTLQQHVLALKRRTLQQLQNLEKKMNKAERKKHEATRRQIAKLKARLFPGNSLQERVENIGVYYAKWSTAIIDELYLHSLPLEQQFILLLQESEL